MMREHELSEFELERDNFKLRIRKQAGGHWVAAAPAVTNVAPAPVAPHTAGGPVGRRTRAACAGGMTWNSR